LQTFTQSPTKHHWTLDFCLENPLPTARRILEKVEPEFRKIFFLRAEFCRRMQARRRRFSNPLRRKGLRRRLAL
jgi:hypothetical protein